MDFCPQNPSERSPDQSALRQFIFPETCRFPAGGILCRPYRGLYFYFGFFVNLTVGEAYHASR